jgi:hypothetical protein
MSLLRESCHASRSSPGAVLGDLVYAVAWGSKIYTLGDPRSIRSLRDVPGSSLSGTHAHPTMFALQGVYVACRGGWVQLYDVCSGGVVCLGIKAQV